MKTKVCTKCGKELPATKEYFNANKNRKYGLSSYCKVCKKIYNKKHREENKEKIKKWREENKEVIKEYKKKYTNELRDWYIIDLLTQDSTLTSEDIKQYPKLIELKKQEILLKREFNTSPNHDK